MTEVSQFVDHLFRRYAGQMVASLTAILGSRHLDLAEDVVQESLAKALHLWPFQGVPANPQAWLVRVARNLAIDRLRRDRTFAAKQAELERQVTVSEQTMDSQLAMIFLCCHPRLPEPSRVCLTLNAAAGFSIREIARALLLAEHAAAQRIVRAKRQIRDQNIALVMPEHHELAARLDVVLHVLYLIFNEGYSAAAGAHAVRRDLCEEAVYLTRLLASHPSTATPKTHALLSLELLHAARLDARMDDAGDLLLLAEQDRSQWNRDLIREGFHYLALSASGDELTRYHLEASIASAHCVDHTDWDFIAGEYEQLAALTGSPVVSLNRAVAIGMSRGADAGLAALPDSPVLRAYHLLHATAGYFHARRGDREQAIACYTRALSCPCNEAEQRFLRRRIAELEGQ